VQRRARGVPGTALLAEPGGAKPRCQMVSICKAFFLVCVPATGGKDKMASGTVTNGAPSGGSSDVSLEEPKKMTREDWRKKKELEEQRKLGNAPAEVDEEGK